MTRSLPQFVAALLLLTVPALADNKKPNIYHLQAPGLHVTYSTTGIDGKPHLSYQDAHESLNFAGNDIRTLQTEIGTLVSVTIRRTVDAGSTTFSVLIPDVNLAATGASAPIHAESITCIHRFSIIAAFNQGQLQNYTPVMLTGTASAVVF
jgi:hypothetical protein